MSSDNYKTRSQCIRHLGLDLIGVAETHLTGTHAAFMDGYIWIGQNRTRLHHRARSGSGGVGLFISDRMTADFHCDILDNSMEGILWVKLSTKPHVKISQTFSVAVCYLPPANSTRQVDAADFYENLLANVYRFQKLGAFLIMGDLNSRCANSQDYIEGVDTIAERNVVDFSSNAYGELLIQFLISANCCILNGRNYCNNDFTCVSTKGLSVVDYFIVPHENLHWFSDFTVTRSKDLFTQAGCVSIMDTSRIIPDHSCLTCSMALPVGSSLPQSIDLSNDNMVSFTAFDLSTIPDHFLSSDTCQAALRGCIEQLEASAANQLTVDSVYAQFCDIVKHEMQTQLPHRNIVIKAGRSNKKRRTKKVWWTDEHTLLWNSLCEGEKVWASCPPGPARAKARAIMKDRQRKFDRSVQAAKRHYWRMQQENIQELECNDPKAFWRQVNQLGVVNERQPNIPWEVLGPDGSPCNDKQTVLESWRSEFSSLFQLDQHSAPSPLRVTEHTHTNLDVPLNQPISEPEIVKALHAAKTRKAYGYDGLPADVLKNGNTLNLLHTLFNQCFLYGVIPEMWKYGIINPIYKGGGNDKRVPLNYRGITLTSATYKLFCSVIHNRVTEWAELNNIIADEQNGFRKKRSCIDHISTLTTIIDTRKKLKKSTFCSFIDFSKAFDHINRSMLWEKLAALGLQGNILNCLISMYENVKCCVRVNGSLTDWFPVDIGVKQGCILSPILFSTYINDLTLAIKALGKGISTDNDNISILLYADDIVLMSDTEQGLQEMLNLVHSWCQQWKLNINVDKTKVVHFRNPAVPITSFTFSCGPHPLEVTKEYKYLGLVLTECLDFNITVKYLALHANRALGAIIAKCKVLGGFPFKCFTKLFNSLVLPILLYAAAVWGYKSYSCINAVFNRACRFYLGVGKYTPNAAIQGDMGWKTPWQNQWSCIFKNWKRLCNMPDDRLCKRVFLWADQTRNVKNYAHTVRTFFASLHLPHLANTDIVLSRRDIQCLDQAVAMADEEKWLQLINKPEGNKLRTYCLFKNTFETEPYVQSIMSRQYRSALAKFRCGVAPLALETGRYTNTPAERRFCTLCNSNSIESEAHVLLHCDLYKDIRSELFLSLSHLVQSFNALDDQNKLILILSGKYGTIECAKACHLILKRRLAFLSTGP